MQFNKNADISIFLKKEGKDICSQISLEFAPTYRKAKQMHLKRSSNYMANGNIKTISGTFLRTKSLQKRF